MDASVLVELLLASPRGQRAAARIRATGPAVHLPHLAVMETAAVLRRVVGQGLVSVSRATLALDDLAVFPATRHPHEPYLRRVWELRAKVSAYDAVYVALAESLRAPLLTADARLARAPLPGVLIELIGP